MEPTGELTKRGKWWDERETAALIDRATGAEATDQIEGGHWKHSGSRVDSAE